MSAFANTSASTISNKARRGPRMTVAQLFLRAIQRWQRSRAMTELSMLDDRQLEDIGVARNDIPRVVEGLFSADEAEAESAPKVDYIGPSPVIVPHSFPRAA